jgi:L-ascorbate metabolism protein UlaG (beta-lactamase superfamily)
VNQPDRGPLGRPAGTAPQADLTFVGTATTILRLGGFTLLTDPNFLRQGQRAYLGRGLWSRRLTEPALGVHGLPRLDAVLLSHLHGDHFDRVARRGLDRSPPVLTTPQAGRRLRRYGFDAQGLRTWQQWGAARRTAGGHEELVVESLPAVHAYGLMGRVLPPVMGSLVEHWVDGERRRTVLFSGDTLTGEHLDAIRSRHPDVDVAVVHLGGTRILGQLVTMDGEQGVDFLHRIAPHLAVPVHYDDYPVFRSPLADFLQAVERAGASDAVRVVPRGETVAL